MAKCYTCKLKITDKYGIAVEDESRIMRRLCKECFDIQFEYKLDENGDLIEAHERELCSCCTLRRRTKNAKNN